MDNTKIKFAGDLIVDSIKIKSLASGKTIDIKNQIAGINIYEDLFSPFISGSLSIKDSLDLANALPFIGEEIVTINVSTPGLSTGINLDFYVYKCTDREYVGDRSVIYSLYFISLEAITDINSGISRALYGNFESIVTSLVKESYGLNSKKLLNIENSNGKIKYVSNFWTPSENLSFICKKASSKGNSPSYIFYENREGFNFKTLESLYTQQEIQNFNYSNFSKIITNNSTYRNIDEDFRRITSISIPKAFDYIEDSMNGTYASKRFVWDSTTKQFKLQAYDYFDDFTKHKHLNKYSTVSSRLNRKFSSFIITDFDQYETHTGYGGSTTTDIDVQYRQSLMSQSRSNVVVITVPGRFDYTVGKVISLKLFKSEPITSANTVDETIDKIYSGKYLISAINHSLYRDRHECTIELIKESYMADITK